MSPEEPTPLFNRAWLVGFAGHRKVGDPAIAKAVIARELENLSASLNGRIHGVSGAAAGADLLFLDACEEAGIPTIVLLPFPRERFQQDFQNPAEWQRALHHMDRALWCEVTPGNEEAPAAYHVTGREILEVSDRLILLWDGQPPRGLGGTGETAAEAAKWNIPTRVIDATTYQPRWLEDEPPPVAGDPLFSDLPAARSIQSLFDSLDARAIARAPRSRWFAAGSMSLNHIATIVQASLIIWALEAQGALAKFLMAFTAAWLPWVGSRMRLQENWVADRVRAELLRSLLASHEPGSPLRPPALELFENDRSFLRSAALHLVPQRRDWQTARNHYLTNRIDDQIAFFTSKGNLAKRRMRLFGKLFWIASWGAMAFAALSVAAKWNVLALPETPAKWLVGFLPAVLPGIAAWTLAMISVFEFKRRSSLYLQLVRELERLRPKLEAAQCASATASTIQQIERLLLNELWEWQGPRRK